MFALLPILHIAAAICGCYGRLAVKLGDGLPDVHRFPPHHLQLQILPLSQTFQIAIIPHAESA
jgi:hypothetical protein